MQVVRGCLFLRKEAWASYKPEAWKPEVSSSRGGVTDEPWPDGDVMKWAQGVLSVLGVL